MPSKIVALFTPAAGREAELEALLRGMIAPTRAEPGNLRYDLWREPEGERRFVFDELYVDRAAVAAHRATPHFQEYLARLDDLLAMPRTAAAVEAIEVAA